ncbi:unnamed protein product [Tilletia caries]|uniref:Uncharacterized protein n=1 Tax=Tilletia caries TaxID=13290 RepID=A0ABN7J7F4_9BASI|nr:unnamed protein product [Tilletia caries]CAD6953589.1 unnamed protein product [Tilletia caries]
MRFSATFTLALFLGLLSTASFALPADQDRQGDDLAARANYRSGPTTSPGWRLSHRSLRHAGSVRRYEEHGLVARQSAPGSASSQQPQS